MLARLAKRTSECTRGRLWLPLHASKEGAQEARARGVLGRRLATGASAPAMVISRDTS